MYIFDPDKIKYHCFARTVKSIEIGAMINKILRCFLVIGRSPIKKLCSCQCRALMVFNALLMHRTLLNVSDYTKLLKIQCDGCF